MRKKKPLQLSPQAQKEFAAVKRQHDKIYEYVDRAQYGKALKLAQKTYKEHPQNRFSIFLYAVLTGDNKEGISEKRHQKNHQIAARLLKGLLRRTAGLDPRYVKTFRNEYYWFSKQPYRQYRLGIEYGKKLGKNNLYSAGVGACMVAVNKFKRRQFDQGRQWALKSIKAWKTYFTAVPDYYNAYAWYAQSLGLTGNLSEMERALRKAAKISKRPLNYQEFQEVRDDVSKYLGMQK